MNIMYEKKHTVKLFLHAGLCNQLFMIFATISYAIDNGFDYLIYSKKNITIDNGNKVYWNSILDHFANKITEVLDQKIILYNEPNFHYDKIPYIGSDFNIKGYYQSEKYFKHNYEKILELMDFNKKQQDVKDDYGYLFTKKTIAVHFRIGDYIGLIENHPIQLPEYYDNAFKYIESKLENIRSDYNILYFCQKSDNELVNKYIKYINEKRLYNFVKVSDDIEDWKQLLIMSLCDNFIIANSTFSWFGAYFSNKQVVLYPSIWFGNGLKHHNTKDICPERWIKIPSKYDYSV